MSERLGGHSRAGIVHRQQGVRAGHRLLEGSCWGARGVYQRGGRLDPDRPTGRHRVPRVQHEIQENLFELTRVGPDRTNSRIERQRERRQLSQRTLENRLEARDGRVEIDDLRLENLAPAVGEKLTGNGRGSLGSPPNVLDVLARVVVANLMQQKARGAENDGHLIVDLVGDAARQTADHLHALRLAETLLGEPAILDIGQHANPLSDRAVGIENRNGTCHGSGGSRAGGRSRSGHAPRRCRRKRTPWSKPPARYYGRPDEKRPTIRSPVALPRIVPCIPPTGTDERGTFPRDRPPIPARRRPSRGPHVVRPADATPLGPVSARSHRA